MPIKDLMPWTRKGTEMARADDAEHPLSALQREMNRAFDSFWRRFDQAGMATGAFGQTLPRTDIVETDRAIEVSIELPGLDEKDIEVSLAEDTLTIRGEKKVEREESRKGYFLSERSHGSFHRAIALPSGVATDGVNATFSKGVLTITLPKAPEAAAKTKRIEIKSA
jgi:HSP20 family protein